MRFGVNVPIFNEYADARYLAELARDTEQAGWDGFFVWDHMATPWGDAVGDVWITLAAAAVLTDKIKIGPMVTPVPRRRPWKVARETGFRPTPVQSPRIPIWVAGTWPIKAPFRRAAKWDGAFPIKMAPTGDLTDVSPEDIKEIVAFITEHRTADRPFDMVVGSKTQGDGSDADAETIGRFEEAGVTWFLEDITPDRWGTWDPPWPIEQMRERIRKGPPKLYSNVS